MERFSELVEAARSYRETISLKALGSVWSNIITTGSDVVGDCAFSSELGAVKATSW